jgi:hypothetical protein
LLELLLLELLRLALLLVVEVFLDPRELEPDLVGMILSFRRCITDEARALFLGSRTTLFVPLLFSSNKSDTNGSSGGARPPLRERNDRLHKRGRQGTWRLS